MKGPSSWRGKDTVPARLQPGEFVVKKSAVRRLGERTMKSINKGKLPKKGGK